MAEIEVVRKAWSKIAIVNDKQNRKIISISRQKFNI